MKSWMEEISAKAMMAFASFHKRANSIYIWGSILDLVFSFLRNGLAYTYLIYLVLNNPITG